MKLKTYFALLAVYLLAGLTFSACRPGSGPDLSPTALPTKRSGALSSPTAILPQTSAAESATPAPVRTKPSTPEPTLETGFWRKDLRLAVSAALDREALVQQVFSGQYLPAYGMVPPSDPFSGEPFRERYGSRDLELAKELLSRAGYTPENPFIFDLWYPQEGTGGSLDRALGVIEAQLEETGSIDVNLQQASWAEFNARYRSGELPAFILTWSPDFLDVDTWLSPFASCAGSAALGAGYCGPEMESLLTQAAAARDPVERGALYNEIGALYAEEAPTLPLFWEPDTVAFREGVQGVSISPTSEFNYNRLSFAEDYLPAAGSPDTVTIGTTDRVVSLDPNDAYTVHDWEILKNTGVPLLQYSPGTRELAPGAAELPEVSADGKVYTFMLRPGIHYADGTSLLAQDYVYAFQRLASLDGEVAGLVTQYVADVAAPDAATVVITLKNPSAFFPALAATAAFVPANPAEFSLAELNRDPGELNGIGPYRMVSHTPGEKLVLEANPLYFGTDKPAILNVIIRYLPDPGSLSQAFEAGEIDIAWRSLGPVETARLEAGAGSTGLILQDVDALTLYLLVFNHTLP